MIHKWHSNSSNDKKFKDRSSRDKTVFSHKLANVWLISLQIYIYIYIEIYSLIFHNGPPDFSKKFHVVAIFNNLIILDPLKKKSKIQVGILSFLGLNKRIDADES